MKASKLSAKILWVTMTAAACGIVYYLLEFQLP